jgi:hypothetical protein
MDSVIALFDVSSTLPVFHANMTTLEDAAYANLSGDDLDAFFTIASVAEYSSRSVTNGRHRFF